MNGYFLVLLTCWKYVEQTRHHLPADAVRGPTLQRHQFSIDLRQVVHGANEPVGVDARVQHRRNVPGAVVGPTEAYSIRRIGVHLALDDLRLHAERANRLLLGSWFAARCDCFRGKKMKKNE